MAFDLKKNIWDPFYESTPFDNVAKMTRAAVAGDWGEAAKQLGYGAFDTALWLVPGGGAVKGAAGAGKIGLRAAAKQLGAKQAGKLFLRGAISPTNKALVPGLSKGARLALGFYGPVGPIGLLGNAALNPVLGAVGQTEAGRRLVGTGMNAVSALGNVPVIGDAATAAWKLALKDVAPQSPTAVTGVSYGANASGPMYNTTPSRPTVAEASAADKRIYDEYYSSRVGAQQAAEEIPSMGAPTTAPGGLMPLSPEEIQYYADQERMLQREYDNLMNQLLLSEKQANLDAASARYGIQREATGSELDLGAQMAAAGIDDSPAAAIAAEQLVQGKRSSQEAGVAKNLADLIAQIQQNRVQAGSDKALGLLQLKAQQDQNRIRNTRDYLFGQYENYGGM